MSRSTTFLCAIVALTVIETASVRAEILIATAGPFTGQNTFGGEQIQQDAEMAVDDPTDAGGVLGQSAELLIADDACDSDQAVSVAKKLVNDGVVFVAGHPCSYSSIPASKVYEAAGVVAISPASTSPKLPEEGGPNVFRVAGRDDQQGIVAGDYLADVWGGKKVAILHDGSTSGEGLASETRKQLRKRDITEALYEAYVPGRRPDFARKSTAHINLKGEMVNLAAWDRAYEEKCYFFKTEYKKSKKIKDIERLLRIIKNEPQISKHLLGKAASEKVAVCEDNNQLASRGYYDYDYHVIGLLRGVSLSKRTLILVHELRHVDQVSQGYYHSLDYDINEMVRLTFAVEADANAIMTLFAWRMKQLGFVDPWITLRNSEKYSDIPKRFEAEMKNDSNEITATRAAFIQWYQSDWRVTSYYRTALSGYLDLLDETKRLRRYNKLPEDYLDGLCILPAGENYGCHLTKEVFTFPSVN
jgi:hypothetical protein